ncbi:hypothetical protein RND71_009688 [Anisodus tanguticus]|uniref:Uncharacterized protein n=1 Tax=Anisodus tanguticus TaxID=243964 RepID=A0AAE1SFV9_9SOLA|nr:hypothetical protein RND71_009688 [Anisodus tanguticus]
MVKVISVCLRIDVEIMNGLNPIRTSQTSNSPSLHKMTSPNNLCLFFQRILVWFTPIVSLTSFSFCIVLKLLQILQEWRLQPFGRTYITQTFELRAQPFS